MRYVVNENCIGCGLCEATCPAVFHLKDLGVAEAIATDVPAEEETAAAEAKENCPASAIEEA